MSFWSDLGASITAEVKVLESQAIALVQHFKPMIEADAASLGKAAVAAVLAQAPLLISGQEKLSGAISSVSSTLAAQSKTAGLALIESAVQASYNAIGMQAPKPTA